MKLCILIATLLIAPISPAGGETEASRGVRPLSEKTLPVELRLLLDIRWASADSVYLTAAKKGGLELRFEPELGTPQVVMPVEKSRDGFWTAKHVAASASHLVMALPVHTIAWRNLPSWTLQTKYLAAITDLDIHGTRLVALGAQRNENRFAPEGAIGWIGSLDQNLDDLKPVLYSRAGPGARPMAACGPYDLSKARFLSDGSFVLAPGVEPGIFLYSPAGQLLHTWQTAEIGIDAECGIAEDEKRKLFRNLEARAVWVNQRRTLDEILPLPEGPGLVVRTVDGDTTRWQMKVLRGDDVEIVGLPFIGPSPYWHLRADVRDGKIVFLLVDLRPNMETADQARLVFTSLPE